MKGGRRDGYPPQRRSSQSPHPQKVAPIANYGERRARAFMQGIARLRRMATNQASRDLTFAYKAFPWALEPPIAQNPVMPSSLRAFFVATTQAFSLLVAHFFLEAADIFFDTILPFLFWARSLCFKPPAVFALRPANTDSLARGPLAILDTTFAFM